LSSPLKISGTRLLAHDENGGASVKLLTNKESPELVVRAWTQSDRYANTGHPEVITPVITHVADLTSERLNTLARSPSYFAKGADGIIANGLNLRSGAIAIAAGMPRGAMPWDGSLDEPWILAGADTRADAVALVGIKNERVNDIIRRLRAAERVMAGMPDAARKHVVPTVRLDSKHFEPSIRRLIEEGAPVIAIEFHGLTRGIANLRILHNWLRIAKNPPYVIGLNVPRSATRYGGSGSLLAAWGGVQASAQSVFHGWFEGTGTEQEKIDEMKWFVQPDGGYLDADSRPKNWMTGDTCPNAGGHFAADLTTAYNLRRLHETYCHAADARPMAKAIADGTYARDYLRPRRLLARTLDEIN
jgi:hypothetical protein